MSAEGYSLSALEYEVEELRNDLIAFTQAYDIMRKRVHESSELSTPRYPSLHTWSGTRAIMGAQEMAIHAIERTILEHIDLIEKIRMGELKNLDPARPVLSLVREIDTP